MCDEPESHRSNNQKADRHMTVQGGQTLQALVRTAYQVCLPIGFHMEYPILCKLIGVGHLHSNHLMHANIDSIKNDSHNPVWCCLVFHPEDGSASRAEDYRHVLSLVRFKYTRAANPRENSQTATSIYPAQDAGRRMQGTSCSTHLPYFCIDHIRRVSFFRIHRNDIILCRTGLV